MSIQITARVEECSSRSYISYKDAAVKLWGEAGEHCHDCYSEARQLYFPELPEQLPIVMGITAYGHCVGLTRPDWEHGPRITIASNLFNVGANRVADTIVHECLHVWLFVTGQNMSHDSQAWYAAVNRLSPAILGHDVKVKRGAGKKSVRVKNTNWHVGSDQPKTLVRKVPVAGAAMHGVIARWPSSMRPVNYDWGKLILCPSY
jgi:hypothetical protein